MAIVRVSLVRIVVPLLLIALESNFLLAQLYQVLPNKRDRRTTREMQPAPSNGASSESSNTQINVEIFTGKEGVGYLALRWQASFDRAGVSARIRPGIPSDTISIREKRYGKLRQVFLVGKLDRNGGLVFPGKSFTASDAGAFEDWLRELKAYGAQGNPSSSPMWGLTKDQFDELFRALSHPVEVEVADQPFDEAIRGLRLPSQFPFRLSGAADRILGGEAARGRTQKLRLKGFAQGTALAMLLSQYGAGFRPNRKPDGTIELLCTPLDDPSPCWSVGWDAPEGSYPSKIAPKLFQQTIVELKDQKLMDVLDAIAEKTSTAIRINLAATEASGLDLESIPVNVARGRMTWSTLIAKATNPSFLIPKIRRDEANNPFVWITVLPHKRPVQTIHVGPRGVIRRDPAAEEPM